MALKKPSEEALETAGHEIKENPPKILSGTAKKFGPARAAKQRVAILLSKARRVGMPSGKSIK